jgi:acyl-CoA:6-aminopenicillanic acid acyl transferase
MTHAHYYEVAAETHAELGAKLGDLFGEIARENVEEAREQRHWARKVAASKGLLEAARRHFPQYVEELQAYASAADVDLHDLWAVSLEDELESFKREKCTTVVTNGGTLLSHNEDWDEDSADAICLLRKTLAGLTILEIYYYAVPLGGSALSVNSNGYIQAINSLGHADWQVGVPKNVIGRWLSQTRDIRADFERLKAIPRSSGYNHVFVKRGGAVFDMESTATRQTLVEPALPYVHTNHLLSPELEGLDTDEMGEGTFERYQAACHLMKPSMTVPELMALTDDKSRGRMHSIMNRETIGKTVIDLETRVAKVWLRREKKLGWIDYPLDFL